MAIGVYRIYVAHGLTGPDAWGRLVAVLDALPGFLYRIDRISDEDLALAAGDADALKGAVRVAMTQSHIAITTPRGPGDDLAHLEISLAQTGFRRRIPVLGVVIPPATSAAATAPLPTREGLDRIVRLETHEVLGAIQELAEQAAAERRVLNQKLMSQGLRLVTSPTVNLPAQSPDHSDAAAVRSLPVAGIMASLADLRASREDQRWRH